MREGIHINCTGRQPRPGTDFARNCLATASAVLTHKKYLDHESRQQECVSRARGEQTGRHVGGNFKWRAENGIKPFGGSYEMIAG